MKKRRKPDPYSDKAMAEFLKISPATIVNWKNDDRNLYKPARLGFIAVKNGLTESDIKALAEFKKNRLGDDLEEHD